MGKLLIKLFIKDYENINNVHVRANYGKLAGLVGIMTNIILSVAKIIIGLISMSVAILADGINNLSDAGSSIITLVGFKLSSRPPDEDHPFGHQRIEYISGLFVAILIIVVGILLGKSSIERMITPEVISVNKWLFITLGSSVVIKIWQYLFYHKISKMINSTALKATAHDSLNDVIATLIILIGALIYFIKGINIDGYLGLLVSAYIVISGIKLIKETTNPLIGTMPDPKIMFLIEGKIKSYQGVLGVHDLIVHSYGPNQVFATAHVEVDSKQDILISHNIIDQIERDFRQEFKIDLLIHIDPVEVNCHETNLYKMKIEHIINNFDKSLSIHDFRLIKTDTKTNVLFDIEMPFQYHLPPKELKNIISNLIKQEDNNLNVIIRIDQFYYKKGVTNK